MKQPTIETERCIIREILPSDLEGMFELDSNPNVHLYIERKPVKTLDESLKMIQNIRGQYKDLKIGRWAVVQKHTGEFMGWTGFKMNTEAINGHRNFIDLGYRFIERFWGQGYASETGWACMKYGFNTLNFETIYSMADCKNKPSNHIIKKLGLDYVSSFDWDDVAHHFYKANKAEWLKKYNNK